jgi:hypothetical protein
MRGLFRDRALISQRKKKKGQIMARKGGHNRGIVLKDGKWWARVYVAGREKWYRADNKSQAKAIYARIQAEKREQRYFPEQFDPVKAITLRAWISRCLEGMASRGLRNMPHYGKFWQRFLGPMPLSEISADALRHLQAKMVARQTRSHRTINRYFAALRRFLNLALAEGYLKSNPVRRPVLSRADRPPEILERCRD